MHCILLGPPGAGKGTQAQHLVEVTGLAHIATGDMFRDHLRRQTDLGRAAQTYIDHVLLIDVSPATVTARLSGRWTCPTDGAVYHETNNPPAIAGRFEAMYVAPGG